MLNYIYGIVLIIIIGVSSYCYKLYNDNLILKIDKENLEKSIDEQYQVILKNKKDFDTITEVNKNLASLTASQEDRIGTLKSIFEKEKESVVIIDNKEYRINVKRDIGAIAVKKPVLVQNLINRGTMDTFKCFEKITDKNYKGELGVCK